MLDEDNNEGGVLRKTWSVIWAPLILLACLIILHKPIENLFSKILVAPVFSQIQFIGNPFAQLALAIVIIIGIAYTIYKWRIGFRYSIYRLVWSLFFVSLYAFFRFVSLKWKFTDWIQINEVHFKAADILFLLPLPFVSALWKIKVTSFDKKQIGFSTDQPYSIPRESDKHQRWRYIDAISQLLANTDLSVRAFAIGISGTWGSGKTTLMNTLETQLGSTFVQLHFNPWRISESKDITEAFFSEFSYQLSLRTDTLVSDLAEYARAVAGDNSSNPLFAILRKSLPSIQWNKSSVEELRTRINASLKSTGKKFVIYIDDLDRLDDEEIIEVLRIIRNSADFANLIFIVAYDKSQVASALGSKFKHGNSKYIEKVFQHEFHLPPLDKNELLEELNKQLEVILSVQDNDARKLMFENKAFNLNYYSFKNYLKHYRDVYRYVNLFKVHYPLVQGQVFIPDLYRILLLRLKYPSLATLIYEHRDEFLTNFGHITIRFEDSKYIELQKQPDSQRSKLADELNKHYSSYGLTEGEVEEVLDMLNDLFPASSPGFSVPMNSIPNHEFTIRDADYFDRYFDEDLNRRLSNIEFQKAYAQPKEIFLKKVEEWIVDVKVASDLIKTLQRREQFSNKEDFDKVLSALAFIADYPEIKGKENPYYWAIDERKALGRVAYEQEDTQSKTIKLFGGFQAFKDYLINFLKEDLRFPLFKFRMLEKFAKHTGDLMVVSSKEAREIIRKNVFEQLIADEPKVTLDLLRLYNILMSILPENEREPLKLQLREFIFKKEDVDGFIKWIISPTPFVNGKYNIDDWARQLFGGSIEPFVEKVKEVTFHTQYREEFLDFYKSYELQTSANNAIAYEFKVIPVRSLNNGDEQ